MRPSWGILAAAIGLHACLPSPPVVVAPVEEQRCSRSFQLEGISAAVERQAALAAEDWRSFSGGRVQIGLGVGADELIGLEEDDPRAIAIAREHDSPRAIVLGLTRRKGDRYAVVYVMLARVSRARLWRVLAHEMGHSCGLEDLAEVGEVMSGDEGASQPPVTAFGAGDRAHCASRGLCDP